jgi:hypothetical protein
VHPEDPESTEKKETKTNIDTIRGPVTHIADFREYKTCFDVNFEQDKSPKIKWLDNHSFLGCRVSTNTYVHVNVYGYDRKKPSHVLSHYNNVKNGEMTLLSIRAEEISTRPGLTFYEIDREDEELRFHSGHAPDHLWVTFSFSRFAKKRYQAFYGPHQQSDVTIGMIGGFAFFFFLLYQVIAYVTKIFSSSGGEAQPLVH